MSVRGTAVGSGSRWASKRNGQLGGARITALAGMRRLSVVSQYKNLTAPRRTLGRTAKEDASGKENNRKNPNPGRNRTEGKRERVHAAIDLLNLKGNRTMITFRSSHKPQALPHPPDTHLDGERTPTDSPEKKKKKPVLAPAVQRGEECTVIRRGTYQKYTFDDVVRVCKMVESKEIRLEWLNPDHKKHDANTMNVPRTTIQGWLVDDNEYVNHATTTPPPPQPHQCLPNYSTS